MAEKPQQVASQVLVVLASSAQEVDLKVHSLSVAHAAATGARRPE